MHIRNLCRVSSDSMARREGGKIYEGIQYFIQVQCAVNQCNCKHIFSFQLIVNGFEITGPYTCTCMYICKHILSCDMCMYMHVHVDVSHTLILADMYSIQCSHTLILADTYSIQCM